MATTEILELREAIRHMKASVEKLRARHGAVAAVQRLANDIDRLSIDAAELMELDDIPPLQRNAPTLGEEIVVVHDHPYDQTMWRDADDEGLGGLRNQ